eukprot:COSAG06_NODE_35960_length_453_cov_1.132768_1_plen_26_part_01
MTLATCHVNSVETPLIQCPHREPTTG